MWKFGVFTMNQYWFLRAPLPVGQIVTGRELLWAKIEVSIPPPFSNTWALYRPGHWLASSLVQHASTIGDSRLCCLCSDP